MHFDLSREQRDLQRVLRAMLADTGMIDAIVRRSTEDDERGPRVWHQLASEMGLVGLTMGGGDAPIGTHVDLSVVARELGRVLYSGPYLSTVLAGTCLDEASLPDESAAVAREALSRIMNGDSTGAVAGLRPFESPMLEARQDEGSGGWFIDGVDELVLDGMEADVVVAFADTGDSLGLFVITHLEDTKRSVRPHVDLNRKLASVEFVHTRAQLVEPDASRLRDRVADLACVYLSSELVGVAEKCLEMMVEHATQRVQFGQPLGSFQAVKHLCAEAALSVESIDSQVLYAAYALDEPSESTSSIAHMAKASSSDAAFEVAGNLIQVLGGTGYTWEHSAHHYFRRASSSRQLFGSPAQHRDRVATAMFAGVRP